MVVSWVIGVPSNHPIEWDFLFKPSSYWGTPISGNPHMVIYSHSYIISYNELYVLIHLQLRQAHENGGKWGPTNLADAVAMGNDASWGVFWTVDIPILGIQPIVSCGIYGRHMTMAIETQTMTGWWFGCHFLFSHQLGIIIPSDYNWLIFFRGVAQSPTRWGFTPFETRKYY